MFANPWYSAFVLVVILLLVQGISYLQGKYDFTFLVIGLAAWFGVGIFGTP